MKLYAITDRRALGSSEPERMSRLIDLCAGWALGGVDYIQVREKNLDESALLRLVIDIVDTVGLDSPGGCKTQVLVNGKGRAAAHLALAAGAAGVHLPGDFTREAVNEVRNCYGSRRALVSVACHSVLDIVRALNFGADLALFAPIFEKQFDGATTAKGIGLKALTLACKSTSKIPIFALGGITVENAQSCIDAGGVGVAGIRLFSGTEWRRLR